MLCECGTEMEFIGTNWICPKCSGKIIDAKRELEKIIWKWANKIYPMILFSKVQDLAQAILDAKFVRLEDVEIEKKRVQEIVDKYATDFPWSKYRERLATDIAEAKPLKIRSKG